jgi:hypothetical protein
VNFVTQKHLSRRTVLRGLGAGIALPWLDAMRPAFAATEQAPLRLAFAYVPNGVTPDAWAPIGTGVGPGAHPSRSAGATSFSC